MTTQCTQQRFAFHHAGRRQVVARFDGGRISSDGGGLLLSEVERRSGVLAQLAECFTDHRDADRCEHTLEQLLAQRVYALALGYEDHHDHDALRHDPLLATMLGHEDPLGAQRRRDSDRGVALAGKSTINRLELTLTGADQQARYRKIVAHTRAIDRLLVELFIQAHREGPPSPIVLDFDSTDDPLHGHQLGRFFHGYYDHHCYLPLYVTCGDHVLAAKLRPSNLDDARGALTLLKRLVGQLRAAWPGAAILVRADSGFCRDALMHWCEQNSVDYVLGLAKNKRLMRMIGGELHEAKQTCERTGEPTRVFAERAYRTRKSWRCTRRVVGKAEHLPGGMSGEGKPNARFVVTSLSSEAWAAQPLYETLYCARGDMENRIKEQQLDLFADRTSAHTMRANQLRLYLSTIAYTLLANLRRLGLQGTPLAQAQCGTIRAKLLKIGARIVVTARKVWVSLSESYPHQALFTRICENLQNVSRWPPPRPLQPHPPPRL